jgi:oxygen-independent coproporphyrinogen III oxidase
MTSSRDIGLYVHIPFCRQRCHFCAFYLEIARPERIESFCHALAQEIDLYRRQDLIKDRPLQSIYFGGGTPTAIPVAQLAALLAMIRTAWPTDSNTEVTVEAHPSTVTADDLGQLTDAGITRISFGAESMNDSDFAPIGRPGTVQDTESAVAAARAAGLTNINLDLMYGLPSQSLDAWTKTLQSVLQLNPSHLSCYALTVETGTRLAEEIARDLVMRPDDGLQLDMESAAESLLTEAGYNRYEISNYAKPGAACRHNLLYWTDQDYLGLGPSAQSYVEGVRFGNVANLTAYVEQLNQDRLPVAERATLSTSEQQNEALIFGLRLLHGVPIQKIQRPDQQHKVQELVTRGLLDATGEAVRLTPLGQRFADTVAAELF